MNISILIISLIYLITISIISISVVVLIKKYKLIRNIDNQKYLKKNILIRLESIKIYKMISNYIKEIKKLVEYSNTFRSKLKIPDEKVIKILNKLKINITKFISNHKLNEEINIQYLEKTDVENFNSNIKLLMELLETTLISNTITINENLNTIITTMKAEFYDEILPNMDNTQKLQLQNFMNKLVNNLKRTMKINSECYTKLNEIKVNKNIETLNKLFKSLNSINKTNTNKLENIIKIVDKDNQKLIQNVNDNIIRITDDILAILVNSDLKFRTYVSRVNKTLDPTDVESNLDIHNSNLHKLINDVEFDLLSKETNNEDN